MQRINKFLFYACVALLVYMPLHVLIVQSASLATGGIEVWKAAKDIFLLLLLPLMITTVIHKNLISDKFFKKIIVLGAAYSLLYVLFLLFDRNIDLESAIIGTVYNTRIIGYFLLGYIAVSGINKIKNTQVLMRVALYISVAVALFGIAQYFLPKDMLTHIGYTLERGVKPMFFIDDKPDLPRIMSTLKDPNSLGAYLIIPILTCFMMLLKKDGAKKIIGKSISKNHVFVLAAILFIALLLTFSRGAILGLGASIVTILYIVTGESLRSLFSKYGTYIRTIAFVAVIMFFGMLMARDSYFVQNVIFHADESTVLEDPNELRISLTKNVIDDIVTNPIGHGPGTAGIVSIRNPNGGVLTENYYLQIAYEVGWVGLVLFMSIIILVAQKLWLLAKKDYTAAIMVSSLSGYLLISLLIHLWSNEAVALQWWLLAGASCSLLFAGNKKST